MCCFIVKCYVQALSSLPNTIEVALSHIVFLAKLKNYKSVNKKISEGATKNVLTTYGI